MDDQVDILRFERSLWEKGFRFVGGVDEAGRGPLAGPVVASVVVLPEGISPFFFKDSKGLGKREREKVFKRIFQSAVAVGVGFADSIEIDELNILKATLLAVERALAKLKVFPDYLITDYLKVSGFEENSIVLAKGDEKSFSCACASVVAKVVRDFIMERVGEIFPEYRFEKHKGYPTREHLEAIRIYGITPLHRRSFGKVGKGKERGGDRFPLFVEERLLYYEEKLQELVGGNRHNSL